MLVAATLLALAVVAAGPADSRQATIFAPLPHDDFTSVAGTATALPTSPTPTTAPAPVKRRPPALATPGPTAPPRHQPAVQPKALPRATSEPRPPRTSHSIRGKASWYCKAGVSICHHSYPPGSMVAAACYKLRAAMGPGWRGRRVTVTSASGRQVTVKLVDWCGSRDKLIDLYWEPMRRLGGTGVLPVTVRW